ncbi:MAG: type II toxin-antitoxin system VapC family toxin [Patescibacteria group bacterium]
MILLDTQALIWWSTNRKLLSTKAFNKISSEIKKNKVLVSSISIWETYLLVKSRKFGLEIDIDTWLEKLEQTPYLEFIPLDNSIAAKSVMLPDPLHRDPADRFIIATAREHGAIIITSDKQIRNYPHVQTLW